MENKAHYAIVGVFAIALTVAAALFVVWLGRIDFDQEWSDYEVVFEGPVRGLTEASEVRFNGIKVGDVTRLYLEPDNPSLVIARIRVQAETPLREDSLAQLEPQGLTGLSYIQVTAGTIGQALLDSSGSAIPRIESRPAQLESIIEGGEDVVSEAIEALRSLNDILTNENRDRFDRILANLETMTGQLSQTQDTLTKFETTLDDVSAAARSINAAGEEFAAFAEAANILVTRDIPTTLVEVDTASQAVTVASLGTDELVRSIQPGFEQFSNAGLSDLEQTIEETQRLVRNIDQILAELESDPTGFVTGRRVREVELSE
jgi:phospholipid/cholesterol/gamma-HCH transport system substrate-binding protein